MICNICAWRELFSDENNDVVNVGIRLNDVVEESAEFAFLLSLLCDIVLVYAKDL